MLVSSGFLRESGLPKTKNPSSGKVFSMDKSPSGPTAVRIFTSYDLTELDLHYILSGFRSVDSTSDIVFNQSGKCNLAVVANFSKGLSFVWGRRVEIVKWVMEPTVRDRINWRFTHAHSHVFSKIFSHNATQGSRRETLTPPMVPPHVPTEDSTILIEGKRRMVSAIGSRQSALDFHRIRTGILDEIQESKELGIDVFGKGRNYIENKIDGLREYRYSIAIENSLTDDYWTEKLADCFLTMTVPIYLGSPNVFNYFPEGSIVVATQEDFGCNLAQLLSRLSIEDYYSRLPAIQEARNLVLDKYSFGKQVALLLQQNLVNDGSYKRFSRVWTFDSIISRAFSWADAVRRLVWVRAR